MESVNGLIEMCLGSGLFALFVMILGTNLGHVTVKIVKRIYL